MDFELTEEQEIFRESFRKFLEDQLDIRITGLTKPAYWEDMFARHDDRPNRFFLVAESAERRVVGFIIGEIRAWEFGSPPCGWIFAAKARLRPG